MNLRAVILLSLLAATGCGSTRSGSGPDARPGPRRAAASPAGPVDAPARPVEVAELGDDVLVTVDGRPIRRSHLAEFFLRYRRDAAREALTQLVDTALVEAEGDRRGVTVPPEKLAEAVDRTVASRRRELAERYGEDLDWETYLDRGLGLTPEGFREEIGALLATSMRLDRLIRYEQLRTDRVDLRLIVVPTREEAGEVLRQLAAGADLVTLARERSVAPLAAPPPIPVENLPEDLRALLDGLEEGALAPPHRVEQDGRELWQVYRLVRRLPARDVTYAAVAEEIERGLERRPRQGWEYEEWTDRVRARHDVTWAVR